MIEPLNKSYVCNPDTLSIRIQEILTEKLIKVQLFYGNVGGVCMEYSSGLGDNDPKCFLLSYLFVLVNSDEDMLLSLIEDGQWAPTMYARKVIRSVYNRSGGLEWKRGG